MSKQQEVVVGIDVAKESLEVAVSNGEHFAVTNDEAGIAELVQRLTPLAPKLVVMEASGGYERMAWLGLWQADIAVARVNPRDSYHFAQACRQLAKTDRLDADGLWLFGAQVKPPPTPPPSAADQELRELVGRRQQLATMVAAEKNRQKQATSAAISQSIASTIRSLRREKATIEKAIERKLAAHSSKLVALLTTAPGVGTVVGAVVAARLPELGRLNRREVAALVGVAPFDRKSGKWRGESHITGGRADLRRALYMAAHNATIRPGPLRDFYCHLRARGKEHRQALIACSRRLAMMLNAMVKNQTPWRPPCPTLA